MAKKKFFVIQVTEEDHATIKVRAAQLGITIRLWIMRAIAEKIKRDNEREKNEKSN